MMMELGDAADLLDAGGLFYEHALTELGRASGDAWNVLPDPLRGNLRTTFRGLGALSQSGRLHSAAEYHRYWDDHDLLSPAYLRTHSAIVLPALRLLLQGLVLLHPAPLIPERTSFDYPAQDEDLFGCRIIQQVAEEGGLNLPAVCAALCDFFRPVERVTARLAVLAGMYLRAELQNEILLNVPEFATTCTLLLCRLSQNATHDPAAVPQENINVNAVTTGPHGISVGGDRGPARTTSIADTAPTTNFALPQPGAPGLIVMGPENAPPGYVDESQGAGAGAGQAQQGQGTYTHQHTDNTGSTSTPATGTGQQQPSTSVNNASGATGQNQAANGHQPPGGTNQGGTQTGIGQQSQPPPGNSTSTAGAGSFQPVQHPGQQTVNSSSTAANQQQHANPPPGDGGTAASDAHGTGRSGGAPQQQQQQSAANAASAPANTNIPGSGGTAGETTDGDAGSTADDAEPGRARTTAANTRENAARRVSFAATDGLAAMAGSVSGRDAPTEDELERAVRESLEMAAEVKKRRPADGGDVPPSKTRRLAEAAFKKATAEEANPIPTDTKGWVDHARITESMQVEWVDDLLSSTPERFQRSLASFGCRPLLAVIYNGCRRFDRLRELNKKSWKANWRSVQKLAMHDPADERQIGDLLSFIESITDSIGFAYFKCIIPPLGWVKSKTFESRVMADTLRMVEVLQRKAWSDNPATIASMFSTGRNEAADEFFASLNKLDIEAALRIAISVVMEREATRLKLEQRIVLDCFEEVAFSICDFNSRKGAKWALLVRATFKTLDAMRARGTGEHITTDCLTTILQTNISAAPTWESLKRMCEADPRLATLVYAGLEKAGENDDSTEGKDSPGKPAWSPKMKPSSTLTTKPWADTLWSNYGETWKQRQGFASTTSTDEMLAKNTALNGGRKKVSFQGAGQDDYAKGGWQQPADPSAQRNQYTKKMTVRDWGPQQLSFDFDPNDATQREPLCTFVCPPDYPKNYTPADVPAYSGLVPQTYRIHMSNMLKGKFACPGGANCLAFKSGACRWSHLPKAPMIDTRKTIMENIANIKGVYADVDFDSNPGLWRRVTDFAKDTYSVYLDAKRYLGADATQN